MPWYFNAKTGATLDVVEGSPLHDIIIADRNFSLVSEPEIQTEMATEATKEATEEAEDLNGLTKEELIHIAQLMGIPVRAKDSIAKIRQKIEAEKEVK